MADKWESWIWTSTFPSMCPVHVWGMNEWKNEWMNAHLQEMSSQGTCYAPTSESSLPLWNPSHISSLVRLLTPRILPHFPPLGKGPTSWEHHRCGGWWGQVFPKWKQISWCQTSGGRGWERGRCLDRTGCSPPWAVIALEADHPPPAAAPLRLRSSTLDGVSPWLQPVTSEHQRSHRPCCSLCPRSPHICLSVTSREGLPSCSVSNR